VRIRIPASEKIKNLNFDPEKIQPRDDYHAEYQVKVITPIYGGGVKAGCIDEDMPIRASAIRGQLRYWWRFLENHGKKGDSSALFEEERNIWGGMGDDIAASKIFLTIKISDDLNSGEIKTCSPDQYNKPKQNNRSALDYALFPVIQNKHNLINPEQLVLQLKVKANKADLNETQWQAILDSIRWWASFGGIGARSRRGLGAVNINSIKPVSKDEAKAFGCSLILLHSNKDPLAAWNKSISKLKAFRQGKNTGRNAGSDAKNPNKLGRSFWPEADSIRKITEKHSKDETIEVQSRDG
jgi:CRISPR-associated protein Cmr1